MINENRLFRLIPYFFAKPQKVFYEIAQNASRAKATKLTMTLTKDKLTASDNGSGAQHAEPLFVLADTGWDDESVEAQMPAGWGIYFMIAVSSRVTFRSLFGSITLDCKAFLEDKAYRESVIGRVNRADTSEGFHIEADLNEELDMDRNDTNLSFFPMDITVNERAVGKDDYDRDDHPVIRTTYRGNHVHIYESIFRRRSIADIDLTCIWYGIPIRQTRYNDDALIRVTTGTPLTPVLPYRDDVKDDEKRRDLTKHIRDTVAKHCVKYINNQANDDESKIVKHMQFLANCGTQEELDKLTRFYCDQDQPHHDTNNYIPSVPPTRIIARGEQVESENLELKIDGKRIDCDESDHNLFLPDNALITRTLPERHPSWAKIRQKAVQLAITTKGKPYRGLYDWHKCSIACSGKDIKVAALIECYDDGHVYYAGNPENFDLIQEAVFEQLIYSEDGDTYDSQESYYDDQVNQDIMNIRKTFSLAKMLEGFHTAAIKPWEITAILYRRASKTMTVTTEREVQAGKGSRKGRTTIKREKHILKVD